MNVVILVLTDFGFIISYQQAQNNLLKHLKLPLVQVWLSPLVGLGGLVRSSSPV